MNLITCDNRCIHQRDGYCCLDTAKQPSPEKRDGCCNFVPDGAMASSADEVERL